MKQTGHQVTYFAGSPAAVMQKLAAGEAFDVVIQSEPAMAELAKSNGLKPETRKPVVRGGIGMAVAPNATAPDISTPKRSRRRCCPPNRSASAIRPCPMAAAW